MRSFDLDCCDVVIVVAAAVADTGADTVVVEVAADVAVVVAVEVVAVELALVATDTAETAAAVHEYCSTRLVDSYRQPSD